MNTHTQTQSTFPKSAAFLFEDVNKAGMSMRAYPVFHNHPDDLMFE